MDLNTIIEMVERPSREMLAGLQPGDALLGGGTWLYSEPQPGLRRLLDLHGFGWPSIEVDDAGLTIGATCRIAELERWAPPADWTAAATLVPQCCRALLGSFKVWNAATVGGNICLALPAGPMTALAVALDAECLVWSATGESEPLAEDFVLGNRQTALKPGEILRSIRFGADAMKARTAFRQISLTPLGRSAALLIGTLYPHGRFGLTVTASTSRPVKIGFDRPPSIDVLRSAIEDQAADLWFDDIHGRPAWRRHVTAHLAHEILDELSDRETA